MRRGWWTILTAVVACLLISQAAQACPMCANAVSEGQNQALPSAFYYSILFMLSMPFLLFGAFCTAFYRMSRAAAAQAEVPLDSESSD